MLERYIDWYSVFYLYVSRIKKSNEAKKLK